MPPSPQPPPPDPAAKRIGLFGGSFDPVHRGHVALAEACREQARLDRVWFLPTALQPHKPGGPVAGNEDRLAMLRLAISGKRAMEVSTLEIERGGVSYTVDSLRELSRTHPGYEWFLLMGADTLHDLPNWRSPEAILRMATPLVVHRPGEAEPDFDSLARLVPGERLERFKAGRVEMRATDISSSGVRRRVASGGSIDGLVDPRVAEWIDRQGLYRGA